MKTTVYDGLSIELADVLRPADEEEKRRYFGASMPEHVFFSPEDQAVLAIVHGDAALDNSQVVERLAGYQQLYSRMAPGFQMGEMRVNDKTGRNVAIFSYRSNAPTRDLFNIFVLAAYQKRELVLSFSCDLNDGLRWMPLFLKMLDSLQFSEGDEYYDGV